VSSREYVEEQIKIQLKELEMEEDEPSKNASSSSSSSSSSSPDGFYGYNGQPIFSELDKLEELHAAAMDDSIWREESDRNGKARKVTRFGPELFIGKICKIYCPNDNSYHSGRIIDWRSAITPGTDPKQLPKLFCGKGRIASSEFLVRFPAGFNGRKKTLLQWIILEEHSCAVSTDLIHACREKGRGIRKSRQTYTESFFGSTCHHLIHLFLNLLHLLTDGWKPAQLMVRTKLELLPVRKLISYGGHYALVSFFGNEKHIYLNVENEACSFTSTAYKEKQDLKFRTSSCATFQMNKEMLKWGEALAMIELDEQRRTRAWSMKHYVNDPYHHRALTMVDEYSQELHITSNFTHTYPLEVPSKKTKINNDENISTKNEEEEVTDEPTEPPFPTLCPQIQRGLDREWIASRTQKQSNDKSFDAIASMTATTDTPICVLMSKLNAAERTKDL
jgi:hypothetical protein